MKTYQIQTRDLIANAANWETAGEYASNQTKRMKADLYDLQSRCHEFRSHAVRLVNVKTNPQDAR